MPSSESTWWHVAATVPSPLIRDELADYLESCNVETRPVFLPLQRFPMYTGTAANTPNADRISACGLCLPSSPTLSDAEFARVAGAISQFFDERHQVKPSSNAPSPRIG
jgi:dTDP-4-amino-4,6-dideoxygalactose transaminase